MSYRDALESARTELEGKLEALNETRAQTRLAALEAEAAFTEAQDEIDRLQQAIDLLDGKTPAARSSAAERRSDMPEDEGSIPSAPTKTEPPQPQDPWAVIPCPSCGRKGTLRQTCRTIKGRPVPMRVCGDCGNESMSAM